LLHPIQFALLDRWQMIDIRAHGGDSRERPGTWQASTTRMGAPIIPPHARAQPCRYRTRLRIAPSSPLF